MKTHKSILFSIVSISLLAGLAACGRSTPAPTNTPTPVPSPTVTTFLPNGQTERTLTVAGLERTYLLYIPPLVKSDELVPLVFVFHGYSGNALAMPALTGFNGIADANKFIVVYPNGSGSSSQLSWNGGSCCGYASENNVDDMAFIRQIIADVQSLAGVDPQRIYASGFSNGGFLAYRIGCEMADTFAAVAPVGGVLIFSPCKPESKISLIHFHGLNDTVVPYESGGEAGLNLFANLDGCGEPASSEANPVTTHDTYMACQENTAVELYAVKVMGHMWPSQYILPASQIMWEFFKAHPKP